MEIKVIGLQLRASTICWANTVVISKPCGRKTNFETLSEQISKNEI
jgi:hypothetical protein